MNKHILLALVLSSAFFFGCHIGRHGITGGTEQQTLAMLIHAFALAFGVPALFCITSTSEAMK